MGRSGNSLLPGPFHVPNPIPPPNDDGNIAKYDLIYSAGGPANTPSRFRIFVNYDL